MQNTKDSNRKETVDVMETALFTTLTKKHLDSLPLIILVPYLAQLVELNNRDKKKEPLLIKFTDRGILARKRDFDRVSEMLDNAVMYN